MRASLAVLLLFGLACDAPIIEAVQGPSGTGASRFRVVGHQILDPQGKPFVARGINVNGPHWVWSRPVRPDVDFIASVWNFNLIRLNGSLDESRTTENDDLDALVATFASRRVVVLFTWRDHVGKYYDENSRPSLPQLVEKQRALARRFRHEPYVWFEVMDGPGGSKSSSQWLTTHQAVVEAIRSEGADNVVVANGWTWGADNSEHTGPNLPEEKSAVLSYGPQFLKYGNVVFGFQVLWPRRTESDLDEYIMRVHAKGLPLLVTSFGGPFYAEKDIRDSVMALLPTARRRSIGRVAYHWSDDHGGDEDSNALTVVDKTTGAAINDIKAPTNLSWLGRLVWADTHDAP